MTHQDQPVDLSIIDTKEIEKIKNKKKRADDIMDIIHEHWLDKNKEFIDEIEPLIEELLKK